MSVYLCARVSLIVAAITLVSCRSDKPAGDAATSSAAPPSAETTDAAGGANVVTVTATDYSFDAPAEIPAGVTAIHLVNKGPSLHHIQLMKLADGKTLDDFLAALQGEHPRAGQPRRSPRRTSSSAWWTTTSSSPSPSPPGSTPSGWTTAASNRMRSRSSG